jgi:hypothetical protein
MIIKDKETLKNFEVELRRREAADFERNLKVFDALYREAQELGRVPGDNPLEGIEKDIKMAEALNHV